MRSSLKRSANWLIKHLAYAYLLRFPLLVTAAMLGIVFAASLFAKSLLGNLFDIKWWFGIFLLSFTAFITAWVIMLTWRLTLLHGDARFNLSSFMKPYKVSPNVTWKHLSLYSLIAFPIVIYAIYYSLTRNCEFNASLLEHNCERNAAFVIKAAFAILAALLGLLLSLVFLATSAVAQKLVTRQAYARRRPAKTPKAAPALAQTSPALFFPEECIPKGILRWAERKNPLSGWAEKITRWFSRVPAGIGRGYFEYDEGGRVVSILPGHAQGMAMLLLTILFYIIVGVSKFVRLGCSPKFPTLGFVLLLLMLLCWGLSAMAFFLDRFRIPVILPLVALFTLTSLLPWSDHFYQVKQLEQARETPTPTPTPTVNGETVRDKSKSIVVVAANGGGIQAAAWAARVLTGLEAECNGDFSKSVRVVSSVSGGSVGAMYVVNEYEGGRLPPDRGRLRQIVDRVEGSSLDEIAWGIVYPDLLRALTSYGFNWDRGRALEYALLRYDMPQWEEKGREGISKGLSEWQAQVTNGQRPGSIFNTTITDTGQRLPLSTIPLPPESEGEKARRKLFEHFGDKEDISVVTAARLSASFPYVSPAARSTVGSAAHMVDGGYYDNYGISSLVEWLDYELSHSGNTISRVLFVEIRGSRTGEDAVCLNSKDCPQDKPHGFKPEPWRGWLYQSYAPLATILHVRDTGQRSHNDLEVRLLADKWKNEKVEIRDAVFEYDGADPPLSWHLNPREQNELKKSWERQLSGDPKNKKNLLPKDKDMTGLAVVKEFLGQCQRLP
jgi:hypothetical protein